ncbi:hypothetical protein CAP35_15490 [Chitinophagaceae bacterium IBVUCB1]|nr:hypothetical protein CAP35_15490 [Chitinophagaceae bacterium IBVUCB1]
MKLLKQFTVILVCTMLVGCQKDNNKPQPDKVQISVSSLYNGQVFRKGDTIHIDGKISYISSLHGYSIVLKNKQLNKELFTHYEHTHSNEVPFSKSWVNTLADSTDLFLVITGEIDHDGNNGTKELNLVSQP